MQKQQISSVNFAALFFSTVLFLLFYLFCFNFLDSFADWFHIKDFVGVSFILVDGLSVFLAISLSLLFIPRSLKTLAGTFFLNLLFIAILFGDVLRHTANLFSFSESLLRLTATAIGAFLALYLSIDSDSMETPPDSPATLTDKPETKQTQSFSFFFFICSILSFPMTYLCFLIFILSPIFLAFWLLLLGVQDPAMPNWLWIIIIFLQTISLLITFQTVHTTFIMSPPIQPGLIPAPQSIPLLTDLVRQTCAKIRAPIPDTIILFAEPRIFTQKTNLTVFNGKAKNRALAIGIPLLYTLNAEELKTLLTLELVPLTGIDRLYSDIVLPSYQGFSDACRQLTKPLPSDAQDNIIPQWLLNFIRFPYQFFLQIITEHFSRLDVILAPARKQRAQRVTRKHYPDILDQTLLKQHYTEMVFLETCRRPTTNEKKFFPLLEQVIASTPAPGIDRHPDDTMRKALAEMNDLVLKLSLIYPYFRQIETYYKEFYILLKQFKEQEKIDGKDA